MLGTDYVYECEAATGTGAAPFTGEEVVMGCGEAATKQADGSYKCAAHAATAEITIVSDPGEDVWATTPDGKMWFASASEAHETLARLYPNVTVAA